MKKSISALIQLGYWLLYGMLLAVLFFLLTLSPRVPMSFLHWCRIMVGFAIIPGVIGFYSFYTFLFSYFLRRRSWFRLGIWSLVVALLAGAIGMFALTQLVSAQFLVNDGINGAVTILIILGFITLVNGSIGFIIKGFESWFQDIKLREALNQKNHEMELALVKSQLDPHFLFNTINNIDILIEKDSVKASAFLNKLSDIMRFMLYETKVERILLTKELAYIEKYIALQKIRTSNTNAIIYTQEGDPGSRMIAPLLFIPFIENAFKHSNLKTSDAVRIHFIIQERSVAFECMNIVGSSEQPDNTAGGLGRTLIEKRLALLYPKKHQLTTTFDDFCYCVKLIIEQ